MALQNHLYTGNFPLHAVFYNAFFSSTKRRTIAEMIINACPSTILLKNSEGRTALHTNCSQHCNYEPIVTLIKAAPQIVAWKDNHGDLPLHLACKSLKSPNKSIQVLFDMYPQGMFVRNAQGHTPLEATVASGLPRAKLIPRINFIKDLEELAATRVSEGKADLAIQPKQTFYEIQDKSFYRSEFINRSTPPHRNYMTQDDLSVKTNNVPFLPRKRKSDSDLQYSGKVKRQVMDKPVLVTPKSTKSTNYNFTTKNISIRATNSIPVETKLDVKSVTSSPTSTMEVDFFSNVDGREDFKISTVKNEIKWQPPRYRTMYPSSPNHYYYYYNQHDAVKNTYHYFNDDRNDITSTASILSMMRNSSSCEQF